jgi:hypothetical protein
MMKTKQRNIKLVEAGECSKSSLRASSMKSDFVRLPN